MLNPDHHLASMKDQISWPIEQVLYFLIVGQVLPTFTMFCITKKSQSKKTKIKNGCKTSWMTLKTAKRLIQMFERQKV